ncbi:MAG: lysine exporter LysO family protein [Bacteroides sp.]|nr:lysine exporter LysO family protein [Bacteroides sp.]MDD2644992.1 lysine exporter LysO family protein [Bacteroides sp.]MDD4719337.1 lysine exporter LysO family protein [Bacteroides sp.]
MKGSIVIVCLFILGVVCGFLDLLPEFLLTGNYSIYALCALMVCVGMTLGHDKDIIKKFRSLDPKMAALPLMTITGTLVGCAIISLFMSNRSLSDCMAVGSGFGYYSLSSIFITEYKGAEMGTIALLSNILREMSALLLAPLFVRYFGKLAPIAAGGATSLDTTLPAVAKFSGKDFLVLSMFHGAVIDFSVPFLVRFFCTF